MALKNVFLGISRFAGPWGKPGRFHGVRRARQLNRAQWRAAWQVHVELSCRLPLAAPHDMDAYPDQQILDDAQAVTEAVALLVTADAPPILRRAARQAMTALRAIEPCRPHASPSTTPPGAPPRPGATLPTQGQASAERRSRPVLAQERTERSDESHQVGDDHAQKAAEPPHAEIATWTRRAAFLSAMSGSVPQLEALNALLRTHLGSDVIIPKGLWHRPDAR